MNITDLISRLEAARGPDRELDQAIFYGIDPEARTRFDETRKVVDPMHPENPLSWARWVALEVTPLSGPYTASIDASLALVERMLPGTAPLIATMAFAVPGTPYCTLWKPTGGVWLVGEGATPPLAILLALLRALQAGAA